FEAYPPEVKAAYQPRARHRAILASMGWIQENVLWSAGLGLALVLVLVGLWLEKCYRVPNDGDAPAASAVPARRTYRFSTTTRDPPIGGILVALAAGAGLFILLVRVFVAVVGGL